MPHTAPHANSFETSLFCLRLKALAQPSSGQASTRLQNLCTATERLVSHAEAIGSRVIQHLPQFTLHDGKHLWNVLSFMEELAGGKEGIDQLGAGDCAMAVWAAFIHDLGMVLEASELAALDAADHCDNSPDVQGKPGPADDQRIQDWRAYRDGHQHWDSIRKDPHSAASRMRLGIVRAAFVRDTHARIDSHTGNCRIADWLGFLQIADRLIAQACDDYSLSKQVIAVAVSHNQDVSWLSRQLESLKMDRGKVHADDRGSELGTIHWTWIGWLLRLADVFDCDASRTPRILFDRIGITDRRSSVEWRKHLAIPDAPEWQSGKDNLTLAFHCQRCPGPDVEKAIHEIIGWMNAEIGKCRAASHDVPAEHRQRLALPSQAVIEIHEREGNYIYQDIEFRLDRDAVVELLMGESLYGGPELALRELVQNALDAVHLRDQRNKLASAIKKSGSNDKPRQPYQHWEPGETGQVQVTWGTNDDGKSWVEVRDNGVGMTVGTMRRFLTQIGKSYYKSDDFRAEQELMRRHGILCTAISQFGIGFLSVFMLADHVEIFTRPLGARDTPDHTQYDWEAQGRFPFRAVIHGPHGLLAFYPHAGPETSDPGTTVRLWLKENYILPKWNRNLVIAQLKEELYEVRLNWAIEQEIKKLAPDGNGRQVCDPAFEIAKYIVWPLHPVHLGPSDTPIILNDSFHLSELAPINHDLLSENAQECRENTRITKNVNWQTCDWVDGVTGSRIRVVAAKPDGDPCKPLPLKQWSSPFDTIEEDGNAVAANALVNRQLPDAHLRYQCLVNGIRIIPGFLPSTDKRDCQLPLVVEQLPAWPGPGGWIWIDLRREAMPRLRADRSAPVRNQESSWEPRYVFSRWLKDWPEVPSIWSVSAILQPELRLKLQAGTEQSIKSKRLGMAGISPATISEILKAEILIIKNLKYGVISNLREYLGRDLLVDFGYQNHSRGNDRTKNLEIAGTLSRSLVCRFDKSLAEGLAYDADNIRGNESPYFTANRNAEALERKSAPSPSRKNPIYFIRKIASRFGFPIVAAASSRHQRLHESSNELASLSEMPRLDESGRCPSSFLGRLSIYDCFVNLHFLSECLWPSFSESLPALGWVRSSGRLRDYGIWGPLRAVRMADATPLPQWLADYDLVSPFTALALPHLWLKFPEWMEGRIHRAVFLLPLLLGQEPGEKWRSALEEHELPFYRLMLFLPNPDHLELSFEDQLPEEWAKGSATVFWDLKTGKVVYADGIHTEDSIRLAGQGLTEWLGIDQKE